MVFKGTYWPSWGRGLPEMFDAIQWFENNGDNVKRISIICAGNDIKYGKTVSWKMILLDTDGMQCHIQSESMKMGRYALNLLREIKKHEPRPLEFFI